MSDDLPVQYGRVRDETEYLFGGGTKEWTNVEFRLGTFGPFYERVEKGPNFAMELQQRIEALRATLRTMPR